MYTTGPTLREEFQQVILRKDRQVREWVSENLDGTEGYSIVRDPNGLGLRVGFSSIRAKALHMKLRSDVFSPAFAEPKLALDETGVWSAWFGFGEPWDISPNYIFVR
jgi:hypothetical protein